MSAQRLQCSWTQAREAIAQSYPSSLTATRDAADAVETRQSITAASLNELFEQSASGFLNSMLEMRDLIQPLYAGAKTVMKLYDQAQKREIRIGTLMSLARRLGPHSRPPPEYNDRTGIDSYCIPGFLFPCPDSQMVMRSLLFQSNSKNSLILRCLPPVLSARLQQHSTVLFELNITSDTADASFFYSINLDSFRKYNPEKPPILSAPSELSIQAYATAPGYLPSELTIKSIELEVSTGKEAAEGSRPAATPAVSSVFGALFMGSSSSSSPSSSSSAGESESED